MKHLFPWKTVRGKLLFLAIGVEVVMLSIMVGNSMRLLHSAMVHQARWQAEQMVPVLEAALTAPMAQLDFATVQAVLDESRAKEGLDYIVVRDRSGKQIAASGWQTATPLPEPTRKFSLYDGSNKPRYNVATPISLRNQRLGTLHFGLNLSQIVKARRSQLSQGLTIAAVELVFSSLILMMVGVWLTRHLTELTRTSLQVASGDLTPPPVYEGDDDIGQLGVAFNTMSHAIAERVNELISAKEAAEASERAKSESEERLRSITDSAHDAILMMGPQGTISYWNPAAEQTLGYSADEALGKDLHDLLAPERYLAAHHAAFPEFIRTGNGNVVGRTMELFARRKDGREIPVSLSLSAVFLRDEWHGVGILRDISEPKRAEAELRRAKDTAEASEREKAASEERLKLVLDGSNDGIWDWDVPSGRITINHRWAEILGYTLDELPEPTVQTWEKMVHPDDLGRVLDRVRAHLEGSAPPFELEYRMRSKSGEWLWNLDRGKVVKRDEDGHALRAAGTHTDITARKRSEETLKKSEEHIRLLLNSTAEAIYGIDLQGSCTFVNPSCIKILGYSGQQEFLGRNMHQLIHHSYADGSPMPIEDCPIYLSLRTHEGSHRDDQVLWRADGTCFPAEFWSYPQIVNDEVVGSVVTFYDISERKQAQELLENKQKLLESLNVSLHQNAVMLEQEIAERQQAQEALAAKQIELLALNVTLEERVTEEVSKNREKDGLLLHQDKLASIGKLAAGVAHEINNPMGFIMSNLGTLTTYADAQKEYISALEAALGQCSHDTQITRPLDALRQNLDIPFILDDLPPLLAESMEGAERIKRIVLDLKDFARPDEHNMTATDLNQCVQSTVNIVRNELKHVADLSLELGEVPPILCNPQQINQVITNLLVNAAHAIEGHGSITVTTSPGTDHVLLKVADTGCGIPAEIQKHIFDPFFTTKDVGKGTGLGLSITYDIVTKHGGEIKVESAPGAGTTFTVRLPLNGTGKGASA